jgi:hypothetical protein
MLYARQTIALRVLFSGRSACQGIIPCDIRATRTAGSTSAAATARTSGINSAGKLSITKKSDGALDALRASVTCGWASSAAAHRAAARPPAL